jgi:predicted Zn finger-like uncharacterized protein
MIVSCPSCGTQYKLDSERLRGGKGRLRCARCRTVFPVGGEEPAASAALPAPATRLDVALLAFEPGAVQKRFLAALQGAGLRVAHADDGPNALDVARRSRPRLVVTSFRLPDLSGPELACAVRDEPQLAATRTLLVGGPEPSLRWGASLAAIHGADAHLPMEAREPEIDRVVRALLGMPGGDIAAPPEEDVRAHARVAVADLRAYYGDEIEAGRREGRLHERVSEYLAHARLGCLDRFPELRSGAAGLAAWDDEVRKALRKS